MMTYAQVRQDRPSDVNEIKAEAFEILRKLAMPQLGEASAAQYIGRLRYIVGRWG